MYLYGRHFTLRTDHQALTALLATTGSGHKPLRLYRWSERLQAYNFTTQFTPGRDNVVADLLSRATPCSALETAQDPQEPELILMLHTPLQGAVDICGKLYGVPQHQRFLLVAYDLHSKWPEVLPTGSVTTRVVTDFLSSLFARWGVSDTITTDNGPQFVSADFTAFAEGRGIKHIRTALSHPQANGGVERFNQTLKNGLRAHLADGLPFPSALQSTLLHYRATPHATTGSSPALLMLGHELQLPLDRLRPHTGDTPVTVGPSGDRVADQQRRMKQQFDRKHRVKSATLAASDWVRVRRPTRSHKLLSFWSAPQQMAGTALNLITKMDFKRILLL
ncbi:hypothetical protein L3Q82_019085 [Scortum barcoo]|uniref:Uncharacterized protein n=1 Tax=Scortum barcoo TaxID=214431 RepID=A0ACB8VGJ3_9TELE|nr:hypothetical protein L3Q82_019085 [Scortum barcoo]